MKAWLLPLALSVGAAAGDTGVLVQTAPARQGSLPDTVAAYGEAMAASGNGVTLSQQQDGEVVAQLVTPGELVPRGTRLLRFRLAAAASGAYRQAEAALRLARAQQGHTAELLAQRLATRDQMAQANKAVVDAAATLDALTREGAGKPDTEIAAPFDAVVEAFPAAEGERVAAGVPLVTLLPTAGLVVTVGVEPLLRQRLRPGMAARLQPLNAASDGSDLAGRVVRVDGKINAKTQLVDVDIGVPEGSVIPGEPFEAQIDLGRVAGWIVPHDAVLDDATGFYLFQIKNGHAVRVAVQERLTAGGSDVVAGPLAAALPVVTSGASQLNDGDPVRTGS